MSVKGLLFDFNGTLFFDSDHHIAAFVKCFEDYGLECPDREYMVKNIFGRTNKSIFTEQFCSTATDEDVLRFEKYKEQIYMDICLENPASLKLCDGAEEMFDYLKKNSIPYCIATGSPRRNMDFYFEHLGLGRWFSYDNIVYTDGSFVGKPAPDCYILAAERLGLSSEECAVFEDGTSGIKAAMAAKAEKIIAIWEKGLPTPLIDGARADEVHQDLSDWKGILSRLGIN